MKKHCVMTKCIEAKLKFSCVAASLALVAGNVGLQAQTGPFSPTNWPPTIKATETINYLIADPNAVFESTPPSWSPNLTLATGGDQGYTPITVDGLLGFQSTSANMNITDAGFLMYGSYPIIDVLLQVFGDDTLYNANGTGKSVVFLEGQLSSVDPNTPHAESAGVVPPGANNGHWNWMLFSVTNAIDAFSGNRFVGDPTGSGVGGQNGGVNSGTLRLQSLPGVSLRAIALGPQGAFGSSNQVNVFAPRAACDPEPPINLAFIDINAGITNHLVVMDNGDQTVSYQTGIGPVGDARKAVQATSSFMNFGILSNYLGAPCNVPRAMKVCVEFYDDPALTGASFGPEAYATDSIGGIGNFAGPLYTLPGSGEWVKVAFWIKAVNLQGVNTTPLTGGPRLTFNGSPIFVDRVELGVVRTGTNILAGLDPNPAYFMNPTICTTNYAYYAELDLQAGIKNGLDVGTSGGDQLMVVELAGPVDDRRLSLRPDGGNNNLQFQLLDQVFGPSYQDNAHVSMRITYYDDPALVGASVRPQVYQSWVNGISTIVTPPAPYSTRATLTGSGKWVDAYFELPNVNFNGVNQGPQSVVRFQTTRANSADPASGNVHLTRVSYDVIRPCGLNQGINRFQTIGIQGTNNQVSVNWFGTGTLGAASSLNGPYLDLLSLTNTATNHYTPPTTLPSQFFRLKFPPLP